MVTDVQLEASLRGQPTHNMGGRPRLRHAGLQGAAQSHPGDPRRARPGGARPMDGDNGPGQWVGVVAMRKAIEKARAGGVGMVTAGAPTTTAPPGTTPGWRRREGLIGISTTNGGPCLAPWGGVTPPWATTPWG